MSETTDDAETIEAKPLLATGRIPDAEGGVNAIVALTQKASDIRLRRIDTEGLGAGLPKRVPLVFDQRPNGAVSDLKILIEKYRTAPERRKGTAKVTTLQSFIDLVNRHKDAHSAIFGKTEWPQPALRAVIDYHQTDGAPRFGQHHVVYEFPLTDEFRAWIKGNGAAMEQAEFAAFLEEHAAELAAPFDGEKSEFELLFKEKFATPADLIALSRNLEIHVGAKVKRAERLASGERTVEFVEEHLNGKGERVDIPGIFMVAVPAFVDGDNVRIPARLRYRVMGGGIKWFYQLYRWEWWLRQRVKDDLDQASEETALPAFEGASEA